MTTRHTSRHELEGFDALPDIARVRLPVVAALYGCSVRTVVRRVKAGEIPEPQKHGGVLVWRAGDLRRALA
jgi:predicted DNA-binding transcriptional regulator AlpA